MINLHNIDCMDFMRGLPDKAYELAIVDPPYGILSTAGDRLDKYGTAHKQWDENIPTEDYFTELKRVSGNQIVWGGNYFPALWAAGCKGFIFWYKHQPVTNWAAGEFAYTSFNRPATCFDYMCYGGVGGDKDRTHPTQKPVALYKWLLKNYAKPGDRILDTHGGSMSIAIACYDLGYSLDLCELDTDYFTAGQKRLDDHIAKYAPADLRPVNNQGQIKLL